MPELVPEREADSLAHCVTDYSHLAKVPGSILKESSGLKLLADTASLRQTSYSYQISLVILSYYLAFCASNFMMQQP